MPRAAVSQLDNVFQRHLVHSPGEVALGFSLGSIHRTFTDQPSPGFHVSAAIPHSIHSYPGA